MSSAIPVQTELGRIRKAVKQAKERNALVIAGLLLDSSFYLGFPPSWRESVTCKLRETLLFMVFITATGSTLKY